MEQREQIRKQEQGRQVPQQVDAAEAVRRGMRSFLDEAHREINVKRLLNDPVTRFFVLANRSIDSA
jgi:hypothetical protein